jgi:hypothetical protein
MILHVQKDIHVEDQAKKKIKQIDQEKNNHILPLNVVHHEEL